MAIGKIISIFRTPGVRSAGIASDKINLFIVDNDLFKIFILNFNGQQQSDFFIPNISPSFYTGLTILDNIIYLLDSTNTIHTFTITGVPISSFNILSGIDITGIDHNETNLLFITINDNLVYELSITGSIISTSPTLMINEFGLAFDGVDFFTSDLFGNRIHKFTSDGVALFNFEFIYASSIKMVFVNEFLWILDVITDVVSQVNVESLSMFITLNYTEQLRLEAIRDLAGNVKEQTKSDDTIIEIASRKDQLVFDAINSTPADWDDSTPNTPLIIDASNCYSAIELLRGFADSQSLTEADALELKADGLIALINGTSPLSIQSSIETTEGIAGTQKGTFN